MKYILAVLLLVLYFPAEVCAQALPKRVVQAARQTVKAQRAKIVNLRNFKHARAAKTAAHKARAAQLQRFKQLQGRPLVVDEAVPLRSRRPAYKFSADGLFTGADKKLVQTHMYFEDATVPLKKKITPMEKYFVARQNNINTLEKIVWRGRLDYFKAHADKMLAQVEDDLIFTEIDYTRYIPAGTKTVYIGEVHEQPFVQREVRSILRAVRKQNPAKPVLLLTEFLPDTFLMPPGCEFPVAGLSYLYGIEVFKEASDLKMGVAGLENFDFIDSLEDLSVLSKEYSATTDGAARRNMYFVRRMRQLRKEYPDAVFVVYAGGAHVDKSYYRSLPKLMGDNKNAYIIQLDLPDLKADVTPLFNYVRPNDGMEDAVRKNSNARLVLHSKNPKYTDMFGFDLSVTVNQAKPYRR